jgi:hypothetical protein
VKKIVEMDLEIGGPDDYYGRYYTEVNRNSLHTKSKLFCIYKSSRFSKDKDEGRGTLLHWAALGIFYFKSLNKLYILYDYCGVRRIICVEFWLKLL